MSNFTNQLGNWNPQLLREFRGRLKSRSVVAAVALSAIAQILLMLGNLQDQPFQELTTQEKWLDLWTNMTWIIPYALFSIGSFYLVSDLTQEEQRGTLNFIRLAPHPAWKILLGKLLGVPVLPYLTIALAIPLHFVATIRAELPLTLFFSYYLLLLAGCIFWYSFAMLYGLAGGVQVGAINRQATTAIMFTAIALFLFTPLFMFWNINSIWGWIGGRGRPFWFSESTISWFRISLADNVGFAHLFNLVNLGIGTTIIWSVLLRRFRQPRSTLLSKRQSYLVLALLEVFLLGFFVSAQVRLYDTASVMFMSGFSAILILVLTLSICPRRQALLAWSRYQTGGWSSRIWMDKSPIAIATCIQILIAAALILPWLFFSEFPPTYPLDATIAFLITTNILLIYSFITQLIFASKIRNPLIWAIGAIMIGTAVPPIVMTVLYAVPSRVEGSAWTTVWAFFGYPFWSYGDRTQLLFAAVGVALQWLLLAGLMLRFRRTLRRLKASAFRSIEANS